MKINSIFLSVAFFSLLCGFRLLGQSQTENDFYELFDMVTPSDVILETSGMVILPGGEMVVTTRYGEIWLIKDPYVNQDRIINLKKIAEGLHTPMGITVKDGKFYVAQRSEITELNDSDGDGILDEFKTFVTVDMSGNYCEYVHGPIILPDGSFWVNMNLADNAADIGPEPFFREMGNHVPWKGWAVKYTPEGELIPIASGLRSPPGMGLGKDGTMYYSENQGGWVGTGYVSTIESGDFFGHPSSLKSSDLPLSNIKLKPSDIPDRDSLMFHEVVKLVPEIKMPAVRLPHGVMGTSLSWILEDNTNGKFGPFERQLFVADQGQSKIMRIAMEEVEGQLQGAVFQFREGFKSGIIRSVWGNDGSMFVGMSDRGWKALGSASDGIQRLVWTGRIPFEMKTIQITPHGFKIEFTKEVEIGSAISKESYELSSFDYLFHKEYGSPIVDHVKHKAKDIIVSKDLKHVELIFEDKLREGYIYQISGIGILSSDGEELLHPEAFYTLNKIPPKPYNPSSSIGNSVNDLIFEEYGSVLDNVPGNKNPTKMPDSWRNGPDRDITISAAAEMTFDKKLITVKAGSKIKLKLSNPTDLLHNLVIVEPGSLEFVSHKALRMGLEGPKRHYVPNLDEVLFYTKVVGVEDSEAIYFVAPSEVGDYPFVCTFPGHWQTMNGIMRVVR